MAAEYSATATQTVQVNGAVIFNEAPVPCTRGIIYHRDGSGAFRLASPEAMGIACRRTCCCGNFPSALYLVSFHANLSVPTGGTAGDPVSLALAIDGEEDASSVMTVVPAATGDLFNVGAEVIVDVPCICRCSSVSVRNVGTQAVDVANANITFSYVGVRR